MYNKDSVHFLEVDAAFQGFLTGGMVRAAVRGEQLYNAFVQHLLHHRVLSADECRPYDPQLVTPSRVCVPYDGLDNDSPLRAAIDAAYERYS